MFSRPLNYDGIWIAPGSPYKNDAGVYEVIRMAREENIPIIGSCGGFQYMIIEYARNVLNIKDAGHAESEPGCNSRYFEIELLTEGPARIGFYYGQKLMAV